jgi:hypothetical protein
MSLRSFLLLAAVGAGAAVVAVGIASRNSEITEGFEQKQQTSAVASSERTRERDSIPAKSAAELIPVPVSLQPPHYAARQVEVTFGDGKSVHVVVQKPMLPNPPYMPAERFFDQYEALAARAHAGDAAAARMIFRALQNCQRLQHALHSKESDSVDENSQRRIRYCDGVDDRYLADASLWAKMASDGGDYYGRQDWALELQRLNRGAESVQQLEALWNDGYIGVLQALSIAYKKGLASNGEPDPVRAYAYFYLRYKLADAAGWDTPGSRAKLGAMEQARQFLGGNLTAQEQQVAEDMALQLLSANTACCIGSL